MALRSDFYILKKKRPEAFGFLARLVEKIYTLEKSVFIFTNDEQESKLLDDLLWEYQAESFLPHEIFNSEEQAYSPIIISSIHKQKRDVLINLQNQLPLFVNEFERVVEIVYDDEHIAQCGRQKYRQYQNNGYQINTFQIE